MTRTLSADPLSYIVDNETENGPGCWVKDKVFSLVFAMIPTILVFFVIAGTNLAIFKYVRSTLRPAIDRCTNRKTAGGNLQDDEEEGSPVDANVHFRSSARAKQVREVAIQGKVNGRSIRPSTASLILPSS